MKISCSDAHSKKLWVFLYPLDEFERNASDTKIVKSYENDDNQARNIPVEKLTPDEFACLINDDAFASQMFWVRFIEL